MTKFIFGTIWVIIFILMLSPIGLAESRQNSYLRAHYILMQDDGLNDYNNILWNKLESTNNIPWDEIDILYIAFARITPDQNVLLQTADDSNPTTELHRLKNIIVSRNTLTPKAKLVLSLGG